MENKLLRQPIKSKIHINFQINVDVLIRVFFVGKEGTESPGAVDIASASGTDSPGSNPTRVYIRC
jgi:hypothetical protein